MKIILRAALAFSLITLGAPLWAAEESAVAQDAVEEDSSADQMNAEEEADDPGLEAAQPSDQPSGGNAAATQPADAQQAPAYEEQARMIEGAPLGNSNVHVHIVERKPYTNEGRHELVLYPAIAQLNSKFTTHVGVAATYAYHLFENLALQFTPLFHYVNRESGFNQELIDKASQQAQAATALLLQYGGVAGIEVTPMYGKFAVYEGILGHFTFVLNAGAGIGRTRVELVPETNTNCGAPGLADCTDASFGDTDFKFLGSVGAGFRVFLGERVAVRLEVRDLIYTARVDKINGCSYDDLVSIESTGNPINSSCDPGRFATNSDSTGRLNKSNAKALLQETSSDVLNNVSVYTGVSVLF